jgi:hypothetical protein
VSKKQYHRKNEVELVSPATLNIVYDMIREAGSDGLTFPEAIDSLYPGLDPEEVDRLAAILEVAFRDTGRILERN